MTWLAQNAASLGFVGASIAFAWSAVQFVLGRKTELRSQDFNRYHQLIKELVSPDPTTNSTSVDRQMAVVYELRHFTRYYPVSSRILLHLKEHWFPSLEEPRWPALLNELELTIRYLQSKV